MPPGAGNVSERLANPVITLPEFFAEQLQCIADFFGGLAYFMPNAG